MNYAIFKSNDYGRALLGSLEAALFMPDCARLFSSRFSCVVFSFFLPFLIFPVSVIVMLKAHPDPDLSLAGMQVLIILYALRLMLYCFAFGMISFVISRLLRQPGEKFLQFLVAHNVLTFPVFVLSLPLLFGFWQGGYGWGDIYPMMLVLSLYGFACTGYAAMCIFRVPVELGAVFGLVALIVYQGTLSFLKTVFEYCLLIFV